MVSDTPGAQWFKSSHSGGDGDCVEVAWFGADRVGVRDSKNPAGPALVFAPGAWAAFLDRIASSG